MSRKGIDFLKTFGNLTFGSRKLIKLHGIKF